jgi:hypothetical protein
MCERHFAFSARFMNLEEIGISSPPSKRISATTKRSSRIVSPFCLACLRILNRKILSKQASGAHLIKQKLPCGNESERKFFFKRSKLSTA